MQIISDIETLNRAIAPDEGDSTFEGMFCIQTVPHVCSCRPTQPWTFAHYQKKIVVWNEKDDDKILQVASEFKKANYDPKIVEYQVLFGKAIHWDDIPNGEHMG